MKLHLPLVLAGLTGLLTSGCLLAHKTASYDGLASDASTAQDLSQLAGQAADQLAQTYAPARTRLLLMRTPGVFGDALETRLRTHGFAVLQQDSDTDGLVVEYTADKVEQDGVAPSVYARITTSDGTMFSVSRRLRVQLEFSEPLAKTPVVAPAFAVPPMPPVVKETVLTETPVPQVALEASPTMTGEVKKAMVAPKKKETHSSSVSIASVSTRQTMSLPKAVLTVLPYNWRYTIPGKDRRQSMVGTPSNVPWRDAIMSMAREVGCDARFDNEARRVTLVATAPLSVADAPVSKAVATSEKNTPNISALHPASLPEQIATVPPVVENMVVPKENTPLVVQTFAVSEPVVGVFAVPSESPPPEVALALAASAIPMEAWELQSGLSLNNQLESWGERAGYQVIYKGKNDYLLETSATFRGTFFSAVKELFGALHKGGIPLRATLHDGNNVLEIIEE